MLFGATDPSVHVLPNYFRLPPFAVGAHLFDLHFRILAVVSTDPGVDRCSLYRYSGSNPATAMPPQTSSNGTGIGPVTTNQPAAAASENWRTAGETRPLLLAAAGGEASDAAALRGHGTANRVAALASGVGEPPAGSDFKRRADRGREGVGEIGRKRGCFGLWHSQERPSWPLPPVLEAANSKNSTGP